MKISKSLYSFSQYASLNLLVVFISALGGLLQGRFVTPETLGEFNQYAILTSYFYIGLIFVHSGFLRTYPILIGQGNKQEAEELAATVKKYYFLSSVLFSLVFIGLAVFSLIKLNFRAMAGWLCQIPVVFSAIYGQYQGALYRSNKEFNDLAKNRLKSSFIGLINVTSVYFLQFWGLIIKLVCNTGSLLYFNEKNLPLKVKAKFNRPKFVKNLRISVPMAVPAYIRTSFLSATVHSLVLVNLGRENLGLYAFAGFLFGFASSITTSVNQILNVRFFQSWGKTQSGKKALLEQKKPLACSFLIAIGIVVSAYLITDPILMLITPKYIEAADIFKIMTWSIPLAVLKIPMNIFSARLNYVQLWIKAILEASATLGFIMLAPMNIQNIAYGVFIGKFVSCLYGYLLIFYKQMIFKTKT